MRRGPAVGSWIAAIVLGVTVGHFALPDRASVQLPWDADGNSSATPEPSSPEREPTAYTKEPPGNSDLVSVKAFQRAGFAVKVYPQNGNTSPDTAATACTDERTTGARTLADVTGYDPELLGTWEGKNEDGTADQAVAMADSPASARSATDRLLAAERTCQHEPSSHWVRGAAHQQLLADGVWTSWLGTYPGKDNTDGQAPADTEPCGGVVIARNGLRFTVLEVYFCTDSEQLGILAEAAAKRLG